SPVEFAAVGEIFATPAPDGAAERRQIGDGVTAMQRLVGLRLGTFRHQRRSLINTGDLTQLDCIDETVNTITYLRLFERAGWLRRHAISAPATRGTVLTLDFGNTPTIVDRASGARYAVDSHLVDAGTPP